MQVKSNSSPVACAICGRTLLLGEQVETYRLPGRRVSVCPLCVKDAEQRGWLREGAKPPPPVDRVEQRQPGRLSRLWPSRTPRDPTASTESAVVEGAVDVPLGAPASGQVAQDGVAVFNRSPYRRTVSGISKSLGAPRVSVVPLSGTRPDVVVTVAWEISWYQYRVDATASGVRLEDRGDDPEELDDRWCRWNARVDDEGRLALAS